MLNEGNFMNTQNTNNKSNLKFDDVKKCISVSKVKFPAFKIIYFSLIYLLFKPVLSFLF